MWGAAGLLTIAISVEVAATALLPRAEGFTRLGWSVAVMSGYALSIWLLSVVVRHMDVAVAYAVWSAGGTALVAGIGVLFLGESMTWAKAASLALIIAGVVGLNLASEAHGGTSHDAAPAPQPVAVRHSISAR